MCSMNLSAVSIASVYIRFPGPWHPHSGLCVRISGLAIALCARALPQVYHFPLEICRAKMCLHVLFILMCCCVDEHKINASICFVMQPISPDAERQQENRRIQSLYGPKLAVVDRLLWGKEQSWPSLWQKLAHVSQRHVHRLLQEASLSLDDLSVTFSPSQTLVSRPSRRCPRSLKGTLS